MANEQSSAGDGIVSDSAVQTGSHPRGPGGIVPFAYFSVTGVYCVLPDNTIDQLGCDLGLLIGTGLSILEECAHASSVSDGQPIWGALFLLRQAKSVASEYVRRVEHALPSAEREKAGVQIGGAA